MKKRIKSSCFLRPVSQSMCYAIVRCDQLKNKSSRRVTYGNPCYSIGSKANSIYFLNDRSVHYYIGCPKIRGTTL
jgi:hypothetical protein